MSVMRVTEVTGLDQVTNPVDKLPAIIPQEKSSPGEALIELYDAKTKSWDVENFGPDDFVKSYDLQIENVIDCFARNQSTACDLQDGIQTLKVLDAALESSQKQRVIKLL